MSGSSGLGPVRSGCDLAGVQSDPEHSSSGPERRGMARGVRRPRTSRTDCHQRFGAPGLQPDSRAEAVAFWIEIHAHAPEVLTWMVRRRRYLRAEWRRRLWDRLNSKDNGLPAIPARLARLWALLLVEPPENTEFSWRLDDIVDNISRQAPEAADDLLLTVLRPRLGVFPGPDPYRSTVADQNATAEETALRSCAHTEVVLGCRDHGWRKNTLTEIQPAQHTGFLRRHSVTLTEYLKSAFELFERSDRYDARFVHSNLLNALDEDEASDMMLQRAGDSKVRRPQRRRVWTHELVGTWTILIDWVAESYRVQPQRGDERKDLLRSWIVRGNPVLWRLALNAIVDDEAADLQLTRSILLRLLWDDRFERQVLAILRQAGKRAPPTLQRELADAIQQRAATASPQDDRGLRELGPRIAALSDGGVAPRDQAARFLSLFTERQRTVVSEQPPTVLKGRIREVVAALETGAVDKETFEEFARCRLVGALLALLALNKKGVRPTNLWEKALDLARSGATQEPQRLRNLPRLAAVLLSLPDDLFHELQYGISRLLADVAGGWPKQGEDEFWRLWRRGWEHRSQDSGILGSIDALTHAMNTTAGSYASAALKRIGTGREHGESISDEYLSVLDLVAHDSSGSAGLVMFTFQLQWLYENAPEWTERTILPRLRWAENSASKDRERETRELWDTLAFRGSLSVELVKVLGPDLWTAVERHREFYRGENLARFFVSVSSAGKSDLIAEDVCQRTARAVIRDNPLQVAVTFRGMLDRDEAERGTVWKGRVRPWLETYWPKEKALNTAKSSAAIVEFITGTGDAFPDAVDWANGYVLPLDDQQIGTVWHSKDAWQSHPRAAVTLLHRIVGSNGIDPWARAPLTDMLRAMRESDVTIAENPKFRDLERRAAN